jgi:hypothetical protein
MLLEAIKPFIAPLIKIATIFSKTLERSKVKNSMKGLLEIHYLLQDTLKTANTLLDLAAERQTVVIKDLDANELKDKYMVAQTHITIQLHRLQRIHDILRECDILDFETPDLRDELKAAVGSKYEGLYSIGAMLLGQSVFGSSKMNNEPDKEWAIRVTEQQQDLLQVLFKGKQNKTGIIDVQAQKELLPELKRTINELGTVVKDYCTPAERLSLTQEAKDAAKIYRLRN